MNDESPEIPKELLAWAKLADTSQPQDLSAAVLDDVKHWIDSGRINVLADSNQYFRLLGRYPIGVNRIEWRGVREHRVFDVLPFPKTEMTAEVHENRLIECHSVLANWLEDSGIQVQEQIVWVGDGCDVALHMTIKVLLELYPRLFSHPQHHYVFPLTCDWCLNYTMEGQLFLGRAENGMWHGFVDFDT